MYSNRPAAAPNDNQVLQWPSSTTPRLTFIRPTTISPWESDFPELLPIPASQEPDFSYSRRLLTLVIDTIPREIYLTFLLRLPSFYSLRLSRVFLEYEMSKLDIQEMAVARNDHLNPLDSATISPWSGMTNLDPDFVIGPSARISSEGPYGEFSKKVGQFKKAWMDLIDALLRDWKILNIVSALVLPAILTILQIDAASTDPVARTVAIMSLLCALMSLLYGCLYTIRFATMRQLHKAAMWASGAEKQKTAILWSPAVMMAMPVVWLSWSLILFIVCIMAYVWRTQSIDDPVVRTTSKGVAMGTRIAISSLLLLGIIYLLAMIHTFSHYSLNATWRERVKAWIKEGSHWNSHIPMPIPGLESSTNLPSYSAALGLPADSFERPTDRPFYSVTRPPLAFPSVAEIDRASSINGTAIAPPAKNALTPPKWWRLGTSGDSLHSLARPPTPPVVSPTSWSVPV
ncbi:hypothetical protein C8J56DRAFT_829369 [Mycena floridula]|nr:hypothetical protein C8J56DRAFT_829369 [Mycena floridula]